MKKSSLGLLAALFTLVPTLALADSRHDHHDSHHDNHHAKPHHDHRHDNRYDKHHHHKPGYRGPVIVVPGPRPHHPPKPHYRPARPRVGISVVL